MKKLFLMAALTLAAIPVLAFATRAFADSPGQLSNGPDNYKVRNVTQNGAYAKSVSAKCNETVKYSIILANSDYGLLRNLTVRASLANGAISASAVNANNQTTSVSGSVTVNLTDGGSLSYIAGSTVRITSDGQTRTPVADGITTGGVNVGNLNGSTQIFVQFEAKVVCDTPPPPKQTLICKDLSLTVVNKEKRQVKATVTGQVSGGAAITGYRINFGDGTVVNQQTADHTYAKDGGYVVVGYVTGTVNGKTETVSANDCMKTISFNAPEPPKPPKPPVPPTPPTPETPEEEVETETVVTGKALPDTGAEGIAALFAATSGAGAAGYQYFLRRRK